MRMHKIFYFLIFFFILGLFLSPEADAGKKDSLDNNLVKDLNQDWLVFDPHYKAYVPYIIVKKGNRPSSISQKLDLQKFKSYNLNFIASPGLSLFINNKLYYNNSTDDEEYVKMPVQLISRDNFSEIDLLTFYNAKKIFPYNSFYIGFSQKNTPLIVNDVKNAFVKLEREKTPGENIYIILFLLILFLFAFVKNKYYRRFSEFYDFTKLLPSSLGDDNNNLVLDVFSLPSVLFILINSLSWALLMATLGGKQYNYDLSTISGLGLVIFIIIVIYFLKYFYLEIMGWIFNLKQLVKVQFFELVKVSLKINLFLVPLVIVAFYSKGRIGEISNKFFLYILLFCFFISLIRASSLIFKLTAFRNIYLFSYLCTTEILPLVIIIKLILF
jgi:hypothetical protein